MAIKKVKKAVPKSKRKLKPRTRAGNTLTEAGYWGYIRGVIRSGFRKYRYKIHKSNRRAVTGQRHKWETQCAECKGWFEDKEIQLDHIVQCGSLKCADDLAGFTTRMYCEPGDVRDLCVSCHQLKTNADRRSNE